MVRGFLRNELGGSASEYALIIGAFGLTIVLGNLALGGAISSEMSRQQSAMANGGAGATPAPSGTPGPTPTPAPTSTPVPTPSPTSSPPAPSPSPTPDKNCGKGNNPPCPTPAPQASIAQTGPLMAQATVDFGQWRMHRVWPQLEA